MLKTLVLAAEAFVVFDWAENFGAEKPIALGLEGSVIDGLRLLHFTKGPGTNLVGRGQTNFDGIKLLVLLNLLK
jgi:hypothetical protein